MADEGDDSRSGNNSNIGITMDLNLYLGPPRQPSIAPNFDLAFGSDLALGSASFLSSSSEESRVMSGPSDPSYPNGPYSPSHALFAAAPNPPPTNVNDPSPPFASEHSPFAPSYETFTQSYHIRHSFMMPPDGPPHSPYTPPYIQEFTVVQESDEPVAEDGDGGVNLNLPYEQSNGILVEDEVAYDLNQPISVPAVDVATPEDGVHLQRHSLLQDAETRLERLMESTHRVRDGLERLIESTPWLRGDRRFQLSYQYADELPNFAVSAVAAPDQFFHEFVMSAGPVETSGKRKVGGIVDGSLEEEKDGKSGNVVNFECNVCLDIAKEPVVTSCGHLFCWACLYQWLHVHSDYKECPVCKGEVTESNIIPIYGRGSSDAGTEKNGGEDGDSGLKIPPRPRGHRFESWRQHIQRPTSRRLDERIANSFRRVLDGEILIGNRSNGQGNPSLLQEIIDRVQSGVLTRLRARRLIREGVNLDSAFGLGDPPRNASSSSQIGGSTGSISRDGIVDWQQFSDSRLDSLTADLTRTISRLANGETHSGAPASAVNPQIPEDPIAPPVGSRQAAEQASASSTMAIIQGDAVAERNSAGSSRAPRRRGRSSTSGSSNVDGGGFRARSRRRLN